MKNSSNKPFYITTPIYYVNGRPHIGHAYTTVAADCLARFKRLQGKEVFFSVGTDEHGAKIQKKAEEEGKQPEVFVNEISAEFEALWKKLNISYSQFIRTTDPEHKKAVQSVVQDFYDREIIYPGFYEGLYCPGCEQFKTEDDLVDGKCPDHNLVPELMKEETYLMKMTVLQEELTSRIERNELHVVPEKYKNEIISFLKGEKLEDISISRKNVSWGIPLPFDQTHTTYVWVDAFLNYLTVLGWTRKKDAVPKEWPADVQFIGKDILRVHATIWPIILLHLGFPTQKVLFTHGHILSGGKKMSKTLGNVIAIDDMIEKFGIDGTRYLLMSAGAFGDDVDLTMERMTEKYNADLANGLGNLLSRVVKLTENIFSGIVPECDIVKSKDIPVNRGYIFDEKSGKKLGVQFNYHHIGLHAEDYYSRVIYCYRELDFFSVTSATRDFIDACNALLDIYKPWKPEESIVSIDKQPKKEEILYALLESLRIIAAAIEPMMPYTSKKIFHQLGVSSDFYSIVEKDIWGKLKAGTKLGTREALFQRV